jgi:hypothetical protein
MKTNLTFEEVTISDPESETMVHVWSDGTVGDVYRYANQVAELPDKARAKWVPGKNPLFLHYIGDKSTWLRRAKAEQKRNARNGLV